MSAAHTQPNLRLVGSENPANVAAWVTGGRDARAVAAENRSAATATLDPTDPRWVLAVRTQTQLQGSVLSPERRTRVMRTAAHLGVRPFDASVIIAIVQDQARRGEPLSSAASIIALVHSANAASARQTWMRWAAAVGAALVANALLVWWLVG
ncbi:MAG: hypothetical protein GY715_04265 [Planctomycetes bacterium]|nr:hypothetical protein [Planctomycetota bacterium]